MSKNLLWVSVCELKILTILMNNPDGCSAAQVFNLSGGFLEKGTVVGTLNRLVGKDMISYSTIPPRVGNARDTRLYKIEQKGTKAIESFMAEFGFCWKK